MLFDGISLTEGSDIKNLTVDTGAAFVSTPTDGELFYINSTSSGYALGLYVYSVSNSTWERVVLDTDTLSSGMITSALGYTPVNKAGDTMSGALLLNADPTIASQAATKNYVDAAIAGLSWKNEVACATTANITLSGEQTIDGVATSASRVLVKNQATASQNGIYLSSAGVWTRTTDADAGTEIIGAAVYVDTGTVNAASAWVNTNTAITLGTTSITFAQFGGGATYSAGSGLSLTGNVFANTGVTSLTAGTNITLSGSTGDITISSTSAAGSTLTGTSLASNIISSSLTSVGTLSTLTVSGTIHGTTDGNLTLAGGTLTGALIPYSANVTLVGTSTQLSADINYIETISGGASATVLLPAIALGREVTIINNTASTITALPGSQSQLRGTNCYVPAGSSITLVGSGLFTTGDPSFPFWMATTSPIQAGTGITVSQPNEYNTQFATTITNSGVTSLVAGTGISISGSTGAVTISSTGGTGTITSVSGTANQITASTVSGAVTLSLPSAISGITSISATTFTGALSGNASTATTAGTVTTAAQPNITSVGTLTSLTVAGTLTATLTGHASLDLPLSGGTLTGALILAADPVTGLGAATKNYVDAAISGLSWKTEVELATTTTISLSGEQAIDGITTSGSRVLVKNQTNIWQNGIYVSAVGAWSRSTDANTGVTLSGAAVYVNLGNINANTAWVNTNTTITIGTTSVTFVQFGGGATYTAGTGLSLIGNTFANTGVTAITGTANQIMASASTGGVTLSLPTTITGLTSVSSTGFTGALTGNATSATNLTGGTFGQLLYQASAGITTFVTAPSVASTFLEWNGSSFVWVAAPTTAITSGQIAFGNGSSITSNALLTYTGSSSVNSVLTIGSGTTSNGVQSIITSTAVSSAGGGQPLIVQGAASTTTGGGTVTVIGGSAAAAAGPFNGGTVTIQGGTYGPGGVSGNVNINTGGSTGGNSGNINIGTLSQNYITFNGTTANLTVGSPQTTFTGSINFLSATGISAAGTTQGTATALTADNNFVTTVAAGAGVVLPTAVAGREISVVNRGANALMVYPASGGQIDGAGANVGVSVPVDAAFVVNAQNTTQWYVVTPVYAAGTGMTITQSNNGTVTFTATPSTIIPQNIQSANYTCVLGDAGYQIFHPASDTTARTFTIPANSSVAYPIGTCITFINQNAGGSITIAINTDVLTLMGATASTGSRTLATNGLATAIKVTSTSWVISGVNLT